LTDGGEPSFMPQRKRVGVIAYGAPGPMGSTMMEVGTTSSVADVFCIGQAQENT